MNQELKYSLTYIPNVRQHNLFVREQSFSAVADIVCRKRDRVQKKNQTAWSPAVFKNGCRRAANTISISMMVFDIDDGLSWQAVMRDLWYFRICHFAHTSSSHTKAKHKFRVILPLPEPVTDQKLWKHVWLAADDWWNSIFEIRNDPACKDSSRAYYMGHESEDYRTSRLLDGKIYPMHLWGLKRMKEEEKKQKKRKKRWKKEKKRNQHLKESGSETARIKGRKKELANDKDERLSLALNLGCSIIGDRAQGFICPNCGQNDLTFFYINTESPPLAYCAHKNTCIQWRGHLIELE